MSIARIVLLLFPLLAVSTPAAAQQETADFYVATDGDNDWSGRLAEPKADGSDGPFATISAARDAVRELDKEQPVRVLIRGGTYRIDAPLKLTSEDSGSKDAPITYAAYPGETPVVSGAGVPISGWKQVDGGPLWQTTIPEAAAARWYFRQLWVDGRRCIPARTPNAPDVHQMTGPLKPLGDRNAARRDPSTRVGFRFAGDDIQPWNHLDDAVVVAYHSWTTSRHLIESLDPEKNEVRFRNPSSWPFTWWGQERFYVEAIREALDAPGEFHLDRTTGVLTYYPRPGQDMTTAEAIAARHHVLLHVEGDPAGGKPVEHLRFEGLSFRHTAWTMPREGTVDGQAVAFLKDATVFVRGARHCRFTRCEIAHTGGYGLWLEHGCKDNRVEQCHLHDLGAGGVRLGQTSLPNEPELQAERNTVHNCFIHDGGNVYHAGIGVWIGRSSHNTVTHNDVCDFFYTGVSVGWSWGYAPSTAHHNVVEYNHIHHLGWGQLSDMGGIYCLGLAPGTKLRYNRMHDVLSYSYGGWGLYTDEGSTGILMENNVVYRVKDGAFHQHYGRDNIVRNNVLALSATRGNLIRSREEEHRSFTVERNIIYCDKAPPLGGNWSNGNFLLKSNLYWNAAG
ncbi:MAG: right-handed parallel beta-helix repeat-containing protein, partial [Planctomycetes bacterium]|nr:right-handed parallel beta-helix repeat-containing protein [Planctomycetota bacterium]